MNQFKKGNSTMPMIIGVVAILAVAGGAYYFMTMNSSTKNDVMVEDTMTAPQATHAGGQVDEDKMMEEADVEVTLEAGMFYFEPNTIEAKVGDVVKVTLNNVEGMHDFVIDEFDAKTEVTQAGESATVTFIVSEAGEFEFYCSVGNHREQGMVGTLTVTE